MHIEFDLNSNLGGPWKSEIDDLLSSITTWATIYEVRFRYEIVGLCYKLFLESEQDTTLFQLTWKHQKYRLVVDD